MLKPFYPVNRESETLFTENLNSTALRKQREHPPAIRVKGSKKLGSRPGNWLTVNEARSLWQLLDTDTLKGKRDRVMLAVTWVAARRVNRSNHRYSVGRTIGQLST